MRLCGTFPWEDNTRGRRERRVSPSASSASRQPPAWVEPLAALCWSPGDLGSTRGAGGKAWIPMLLLRLGCKRTLKIRAECDANSAGVSFTPVFPEPSTNLAQRKRAQSSGLSCVPQIHMPQAPQNVTVFGEEPLKMTK